METSGAIVWKCGSCCRLCVIYPIDFFPKNRFLCIFCLFVCYFMSTHLNSILYNPRMCLFVIFVNYVRELNLFCSFLYYLRLCDWKKRNAKTICGKYPTTRKESNGPRTHQSNLLTWKWSGDISEQLYSLCVHCLTIYPDALRHCGNM